MLGFTQGSHTSVLESQATTVLGFSRLGTSDKAVDVPQYDSGCQTGCQTTTLTFDEVQLKGIMLFWLCSVVVHYGLVRFIFSCTTLRFTGITLQ